MKKFFLYFMAFFYILAGVNHFRNPDFYLVMMPPYLPMHEWLNWISGAAEILLGAGLLWKKSRRISAWGVILLLIAIFPANFYMLQAHEEKFSEFPLWALIIRLPVQGLLIWWASIYTRKN